MSKNRGTSEGGARASDPHHSSTTLNVKGGAMIMKSVSIFLASGRRASSQSRNTKQDKAATANQQGGANDSSKRNKKYFAKMDEINGKLNPKMLEVFKRRTHFSKTEVEALCRIYRKLLTNSTLGSRALAANNAGAVIAKPHASMDGIDRSVFRELLHSTFDIVTEETLMERIFCAWEKGYEGLPIRMEGWLLGLSVFLKGTVSEKTAFCFRVYDLNCDGFITRDEMFVLLRNCLIKQPQDEDPDEGVKDLVEIALRKLDIDKDGKVSFQDYTDAVTDEPLLLEAFGQCLPSDRATVSFLSTLQAQDEKEE